MRVAPGRYLSLAVAMATVVACSAKDDARTPSLGASTTPQNNVIPGPATGGTGGTQNPTGDGTGGANGATGGTNGGTTGGTTGGTNGGTVGTGGADTPDTTTTQTPPNTGALAGSETLESCEGKTPPSAWVAVVNGGQSPATCADPLVNWCCSRAEIAKQFPTSDSALENGWTDAQGTHHDGFKVLVDTNQYVLYACSVSGNKYTFSMAKVQNGTTYYAILDLPTAFPADQAPMLSTDPACPKVTTADLNK